MFRPIYSAGLRRPITARTLLRRLNSSKTAPPPPPQQPKASGIKALMKKYGYAGLGVYLAIGCIDLPLCYLLVDSQGEDKIRELQDKALEWVGWKDKPDFKQAPDSDSDTSAPAKKKTSTFWTEFAVAYALHKSLIVVRLPLTAAVTPWVVKKLKGMGIDIDQIVKGQQNGQFGKRPTKGQRWFF